MRLSGQGVEHLAFGGVTAIIEPGEGRNQSRESKNPRLERNDGGCSASASRAAQTLSHRIIRME
jgi:hypothetical protein